MHSVEVDDELVTLVKFHEFGYRWRAFVTDKLTKTTRLLLSAPTVESAKMGLRNMYPGYSDEISTMWNDTDEVVEPNTF